MTQFHLSEQGSTLQHDPKVTEYLKTYKLPSPPDVRYSHIRFASSQNKCRVQLFGQAWLPNQAKGTILFIHGFGEHVGNYSQLIHDFLTNDYAVAALDLRGHGLSEGPRGHSDTSTCYAEDVEQFCNLVFPHLTPNRPLYIWAHSMGGLVALQILLRNKLPTTPAAVALSSALLGFPPLEGHHKILAWFAPVIAKIAPAMQIQHKLPPLSISKNMRYLTEREKDPLIGLNTTPRWFLSAEQAIADVRSNALKFQELAPTLFLLAGDELVTNLMHARHFAFHAYASLKHKVIEFPGMRHELEKETDCRARVVSESLAWFRSHT